MNGCFYDKLNKEETIIFIPNGESYIEILGHRIDGYNGFEEFLDELNRLKVMEKEYEKMKEQKSCLHCGSKEAAYCEECYQELIGTNAKLQTELNKKNRMIDEMLKDIGSMMIVKNRTEILLEVYENRIESEE